ncbi:PQQ-dependent sugar dehydrogenase [Kallotenue papyrolyticum]|uniref:PQQ-dependent sugar dehydrogenase n=1 Tax=Kallotenue papyrolyticum TaxID=1325125 RepID=UPI00047865A6|nr:PQQ-dependent sugar dehydrogenase [Kallotenue papyrolyticum]
MKPFHRLALALTAILTLVACSAQSDAQPTPTAVALRQPTAAVDPAATPTPLPSAPVPTPEESVAATPAPSASALPFDPLRVTIELEQVAAGFNAPLFVTHAGDGSGRLFVVEKGGMIRTLDGAVVLDITDRVRASGSEQGLLGLAFHPDWPSNGFFYVNYTDRNGDTVIARFTLPPDAVRADPASELILLQVDQPAANHNGGMLVFGPDRRLYIGLGDGGGANDTYGNGQNLASLLGKLLRIDVDGGQPYAVPPDNPFVDRPDARPEIWAYGLRNPWRFSFDRATGDLYIGDVGQNRYEWIHYRPAGAQGGENYGWPIVEGSHCLRGNACDRTGLTLPVIEYTHAFGCAVTGGYVYRGAQFPQLDGVYFFGDYCSGRIWAMGRDAAGQWQAQQRLQAPIQISSFGEDQAGELYLTDLGGGAIYRLVAR